MVCALRHIFSVVATLAFISTFASTSFSQTLPPTAIHVQAIWGTSERQTFRICLIGPVTTSDENESIIYVLDISAGPDFRPFLEHEFEIRTGEFRCVDFPYSLLAEALREAGGEPEPTGAITFQYDLRGNVISVPPPKARSTGAVMNIDSFTGKIELYSTIGPRTAIIN
jgi:hypothetical protein